MKIYVLILSKDQLNKNSTKWLEKHNFYLANETKTKKLLFYFTAFTQHYFSTQKDKLPKSIKGSFSQIKEFNLNDLDRQELQSRLKLEGFVLHGDRPTDGVLEEVETFLYAQPTLKAQYLGRGAEADYQKAVEKGEIKRFEQVGRSRNYWWNTQTFQKQVFFSEDEVAQFTHLSNWIKDPEARVVLSLGSGGLRLFSLSPFLQFLEEKKLIDSFDEVWGCSGGSIAGYLLSYHISSQTFQEIGYRIYENSFTNEEGPFVQNGADLFKKIWQSGWFKSKSVQGLIDFSQFTRRLLYKASLKGQNRNPLPFFTLTHNRTRKKNFVLANQQVPDYLKSFIQCLEHDPFKMVTASSAIPYLFKPEIIVNEYGEKEEWCDGVLYEETPLATILRKWNYDKEFDPDHTPKKLKVFYVDLGLKVSDVFPNVQESPLFQYLDSLWKRQRTSVEMVFEDRFDVKIKGIEMELGFAGLLDAQKIPSITHRGYSVFQRELKRIDHEIKLETMKKKSLSKVS